MVLRKGGSLSFLAARLGFDKRGLYRARRFDRRNTDACVNRYFWGYRILKEIFWSSRITVVL